MRGLVCGALVTLTALLPVAATAQTQTFEQIVALQRDVENRLVRECDRSADTLRYRDSYTNYDIAFAAQWTGGCANGVRDGFGQYSIETRVASVNIADGTTNQYRYRFVSEGTIVRGQRVGLWCTLSSSVDASTRPQSRPLCALISGDSSVGSFGKESDGSWRRVDQVGATAEPPEVFAPGSLEAESERLLSAARAGEFGGPINLQGQTDALNDLIAGASIRLSPDPSITNIRGKRIAIVLSSRAVSELQRWGAERQRVIVALQRFRRDPQFERDFTDFIETSDPAQVVMGVSRAVITAGGVPFAADDLSVLQDGRADYVIVVDWRYRANIPTTVRALGALAICQIGAPCEDGIVYQSNFAAFLVTPDLRAIDSVNVASVPAIRSSETYREAHHIATILALGIDIGRAYDWLPRARN